MSFLRCFTKLSILIACAGGTFIGVQGSMAISSDATQHTVTNADPIAAKLAEESDLTGTMRPMSPIYPTTKYTHAQLSVSTVKKPAKAKVALRSANKMPMQIAYAGEPPVAAQGGAAIAHIR